jgi:segregation and condensation protein B
MLRAAEGPLARDAALARLEAVLVVADGALSARRLAELAGLADGTQARTLVRRLNELYDATGAVGDSGGEDVLDQRAAFRVEEVAGGFRLMTRRVFSLWLRRLHSLPADVRLSTSALETLAVIAYRQPVLRAELEAVRGVQCGEMLRQLSERDLVRMVGRSPELGRPFLYGTTKKFLQTFGLRSLDELPRAQSLRRVTGQGIEEEAHAAPSKPALLKVSQDPTDTPEESPVKIAR